MGKQPVRMKAVVYALSPFQQKVMPGLWKDLPSKIHHKIFDNWLSATFLLTPLVGTYAVLTLIAVLRRFSVASVCSVHAQLHLKSLLMKYKLSCAFERQNSLHKGIIPSYTQYVQNYKEKEKLAHRY